MLLPIQNLTNPLRLDSNGVARVGGSRVTLETVVDRFLSGDSPEEIADSYQLDLATIYASISYYLQNRKQVEGYFKAADKLDNETASLIVEQKNSTALLRRKLLARLESQNRAG